ncbi:MAG: hypothetical protein F4114_02320 [Rhodospirillaceae bacterium]|nr:hypothetical protein [Rhodospirillaceae bacterium]MYB13673.1 hypothetical protein [Rhodospirillaceae bacterium]MYI47908.1 hypothetical protein [Rhodospirillaceae bacterium]
MAQLRGLLQELRPRMPESLVAGHGWRRLLQRVGDLPAAAASACGFEMKLGDPEPAADFSVAVTPGPVAGHYAAEGLGAAPGSMEGWLGRHLSDKSGPDGWIDWMLLAYDIMDVPMGRQAAPRVYLKAMLAPQAVGGFVTPELLAATLARIAGREDHTQESRALTRTLDALPSDAEPVFAAATPERGPGSIRLVIGKVPVPEVGPFLDRLEWPGSASPVLRFLSGIEGVADRFMIAFDVTADGALPRLGLEMYPTGAGRADYRALLTTWLTTTRANWRSLTERLIEMELCLPAKADGLLSWPKYETVFGREEVFRLHMGINHVKIVIGGERLQAKAYAGLKFAPLDSQP